MEATDRDNELDVIQSIAVILRVPQVFRRYVRFLWFEFLQRWAWNDAAKKKHQVYLMARVGWMDKHRVGARVCDPRRMSRNKSRWTALRWSWYLYLTYWRTSMFKLKKENGTWYLHRLFFWFRRSGTQDVHFTGEFDPEGLNMFSEQPQRPAMRRKSSAQNFLSSFKSTSSSGSITPQSLNHPTASLSNSTNSPFSTTSPTVTTPQAREWDAQSLHSDTVGSSMAGAQSPLLTPGTSVEYLRDLVQKRIITLTYIRQIHEGWVPHDSSAHPNCLC